MTLLPVDNNGLPIAALAPRNTNSTSLSGSAALVLAADDTQLRIVRLLTGTADAKIGTDTVPNAHMPLMADVAEHIKLEAGQNLYASGSGVLNITIMG